MRYGTSQRYMDINIKITNGNIQLICTV